MTTTTKVSPLTKNINHINPIELLSQLADSESSGYLTLNEGLVSWHIYLQNGNISYADCSVQLINQLQYYLQSLGYQKAVAGCKAFAASGNIKQFSEGENKPELYSQVISWLLQEKHLDLTEGLKLLEKAIEDTLESCLWLRNISYTWQEDFSIPQWIDEQFHNYPQVNLSASLARLKTRLEEWRKCSREISSVHQRPYFSSGWDKKPLPLNGSLDSPVLKELSSVLRGRTSIRQLSVLLKKDELDVSQILSPYIADKILYLRDAASPLDRLPKINRVLEKDSSSSLEIESNLDEKDLDHGKAIKTKKIVCIDDSPTILNEIQRFLDRDAFTVTAIDDPIKAASIVFRIKPDLILMDITMPKINGYKLCGLLRASAYCNKTPIIMVTGNTGLIDKARAKLAGATDYFTKPFTKEGLMNIVEKHLQ